MAKQNSSAWRSPRVGADDIKAIVGDIDNTKVIDVLALRPTLAEQSSPTSWKF
jgi:hypothetical protein